MVTSLDIYKKIGVNPDDLKKGQPTSVPETPSQSIYKKIGFDPIAVKPSPSFNIPKPSTGLDLSFLSQPVKTTTAPLSSQILNKMNKEDKISSDFEKAKFIGTTLKRVLPKNLQILTDAYGTYNAGKRALSQISESLSETPLIKGAAQAYNLQDEGKLVLGTKENLAPALLKGFAEPVQTVLNTPTGEKITSGIYEASSNVPLKILAAIQSGGKTAAESVSNSLLGPVGSKFVVPALEHFKVIGDKTYKDAYKALLEKRNDPNNSEFEKILYGIQDSGTQSAIGALLAVGVSLLTRNPAAGRAVSAPYFAAISAEAQRKEKGKVTSAVDIGIDTIGDTIISGFAEKALTSFAKDTSKKTIKKLLETMAKGFAVEGTTEPSQSFLKYANDYIQASGDEEKMNVVEDLKNYVLDGGMLNEFLISGISGALITGGAGAIGRSFQEKPTPRMKKPATDEEKEVIRTKDISANFPQEIDTAITNAKSARELYDIAQGESMVIPTSKVNIGTEDMMAAAKGVKSGREPSMSRLPVLVEKNPDGTYDVIEGNHRFVEQSISGKTDILAMTDKTLYDKLAKKEEEFYNVVTAHDRTGTEGVRRYRRDVVRASEVPVYEETGPLSTKVLQRLEGRSTVSKQFIEDLTNAADLKQAEKDLIRNTLNEYTGTVNVKEFADKVKAELLPLNRTEIGVSDEISSGRTKYENITLPSDIRGSVRDYSEHVYESPVPTNAGKIHWARQYSGKAPENYFGHVRVEDMADGKTSRIIEVQSDLYQKGRLEIEKTRVEPETQYYDDNGNLIKKDPYRRIDRTNEVAKLQQYTNPTAHFRMVREEVKQAAIDGKTKLQFPTGETAMKIEGLGDRNRWEVATTDRTGNPMIALATVDDLKVGQQISQQRGDDWIITDVLGDGKFKAVQKSQYDNFIKDGISPEKIAKMDTWNETFDISGKVDTNNPIYRFYEKDLGRYLKNTYDAKLITDEQGVTWYEVSIKPEMATKPVQAFKENVAGVNFDITPEEGVELFRTMFDENEVDFVYSKDFIKKFVNGKDITAAGLFEKRQDIFSDQFKSLVTVVEQNGRVPSDVVYHEAFHAYFNNFLTKDESSALIKNVMDDLPYLESDIEAEEFLADDFARYAKDKEKYKGTLKEWWDKIWNKIKEWIRRADKVQGTYDAILMKRRPRELTAIEDIEITVPKKTEMGDLASSIQKAKASGQSFDEWVKGQIDPLYEFKNFSTIKDPDIARGSVKGAINDIGGLKNVERGTVDIGKLETTERINTRDERYMAIEQEVKSGIVTPIIADEYLRVIDGHHRLEIYKSMGMKDVPVVVPKNTVGVNIKTRSQLKAEWDKIADTTNDITSSIKKAKQSGQSFDEWVKWQKPSTEPITLNTKEIEIKDLYAHGEPELKDAIRNVENGAVSRTKGAVEVTQNPNGKIIVLDGQHRVIEAMKRGDIKIKIDVVPYEDAINPEFGYTVRNLITDGDPVPFKTRSQLKAEWDRTVQTKIAAKEVSPVQKHDDAVLDPITTPEEAIEAEAAYSAVDDLLDDRKLDYIKELQIKRDILAEQLSIHPAKPLLKYLDAEGQLPVVTGQFNRKVGGMFAKRGDDIVTEYGYKTPEDAQKGINAYKRSKKQLADTEAELRELRPFLRQAKALRRFLDKNAPKATEMVPEMTTLGAYAELKDISNIQKGFSDLYRNFETVFGPNHIEQVKNRILIPFDKAKSQYLTFQDNLVTELENNVTKKFNIKRGSAEDRAIMDFGEGEIQSFADLEYRFGGKATDIKAAADWFREKYNSLITEINDVRKKLYPTNPEKLIPFRKDYFRHFRELTDTFEGLKNLFETPAGIDPNLAGLSDFTAPRTKFLTLAMKRLGIKSTRSAIGGFLEYIPNAAYAIHIDPQIGAFRKFRKELVKGVETTDNPARINNFIEFLHDFANDLAGKTNPLDRSIQKYIPGGRRTFRIINWINNRVKANTILGNASSMVAQAFNLPQGIAHAKQYTLHGMRDTLASIFRENTPMNNSTFIKERYFKSARDRFPFDFTARPVKYSVEQTKKFAAWMISATDEVATKLMWNSFYEKAIAEEMADPIRYADEWTRKMVAGRGIGEVPMVQKAAFAKIVMPFQLEVGNLWLVMKDQIKQRDFTGIVILMLASYIMNRAAEEIRGSDVSFDPINALLDGLDGFKENDNFWEAFILAFGRMSGELLSNVPGGQTLASMYPEYGFDIPGVGKVTRTELFGEGDPTRFGSGLIAYQAIQDPIYKLLPPFGGGQIKKTVEGTTAFIEGQVDNDGTTKFDIERTPTNFVKSLLFGKYSTKDAREFFDRNDTPEAQIIKDEKEKAKETTDQVRQDAENMFRSISEAPAESRAGLMKELLKSDPELAKVVIDVAKKDKSGWSYAERQLAQTGIKNGVRANSMVRILNRLPTTDAKKEMMKSWAAKGLLTGPVLKQVTAVMKKETETKENIDTPVVEENTKKSERGIIQTVLTYAKAIGADPATAFDRIFTGQVIRRVDNDTIIVERMSVAASQELKKERGGLTPDLKLDHTIPLSLGGSNSEDNLKLVPTEDWASYTPVETYLYRRLSAGTISKKEAQTAITEFKDGKKTFEDIQKLYP